MYTVRVLYVFCFYPYTDRLHKYIQAGDKPWGQTWDKPGTNRGQTGDNPGDNPGTNRGPSGDNLGTIRGQTGDKPGTF